METNVTMTFNQVYHVTGIHMKSSSDISGSEIDVLYYTGAAWMNANASATNVCEPKDLSIRI